ncbi:hypothetical protein SASPL_103147 [Salvia splendens]|uniref:Protein kinase domain-containing protein n=1 Tax=Salvia splendens TaxID=180675 RepID=A0A8X8YSK8_SALSN|nr:hypothetical protein SASPL_103147 [Salvia splendens]
MGCFSCIRPSKKNVKDYNAGDIDTNSTVGGRRKANVNGNVSMKKGGSGRAKGKDGNNPSKGNAAHSFTFKDLALATQNFRESNLIGGGGFGSVYKGRLESGLVVAVKQLNLEGLQGNQEFIVEWSISGFLDRKLINEHIEVLVRCRLSYIEMNVCCYLLISCAEPTQMPLSWSTRMKIAVDAARGLEYLHCKSRPYLKDPRRYIQMVDPLLEGHFSVRCLHHAVAVTAMCLQEQANFRPLIGDIVLALEFLASQPEDSWRGVSHIRTSPSPSHVDAKKAGLRRHGRVEAQASSTAENPRLRVSSSRAADDGVRCS